MVVVVGHDIDLEKDETAGAGVFDLATNVWLAGWDSSMRHIFEISNDLQSAELVILVGRSYQPVTGHAPDPERTRCVGRDVERFVYAKDRRCIRCRSRRLDQASTCG